ncbi:lipopolysaccharide biosynthesis protein [bacterium]|nr:lipopolysaccharide biosynthesis protein [bacterium]
MSQPSLRKQTVTGFKWSFVNQFGSQFLNLIISIVLARILGPEVYGLIAMITVFTGLAGLFLDFGFGNALIYKKKVSNLDWSSVFWLNLVLGLTIFLIFCFASKSIASFYSEPILINLTMVIGVNYILNSFSITQNAKLKKEIKIKEIAIVTIGSILISGSIGVCLAMNGYGVWSLVAQRIFMSFFNMIGLFLFLRWIPLFQFSFNSIKSIFSYSIYQFSGGVLSYGSRNVDNLLIGKYLNSEELGLYNRAYSFLMFPINAISSIITTVLFPSFVKINEDIEKLKRNYYEISKLVFYIVLPLMSLFYLCAREITLLVFGPNWEGIVWILKLFSLLGVYQAVIRLNGPLYTSLNKMKLNFRLSVFSEITNILAIVIGINWGIEGVIWGIYVATIINFFPINYFILKEINSTIYSYYSQFFINSIIGGSSFFIVFFMESWLNAFPLIMSLIIKVVSFMSSYLILSFLFKSKELSLILQLVKGKEV